MNESILSKLDRLLVVFVNNTASNWVTLTKVSLNLILSSLMLCFGSTPISKQFEMPILDLSFSVSLTVTTLLIYHFGDWQINGTAPQKAKTRLSMICFCFFWLFVAWLIS